MKLYSKHFPKQSLQTLLKYQCTYVIKNTLNLKKEIPCVVIRIGVAGVQIHNGNCEYIAWHVRVNILTNRTQFLCNDKVITWVQGIIFKWFTIDTEVNLFYTPTPLIAACSKLPCHFWHVTAWLQSRGIRFQLEISSANETWPSYVGPGAWLDKDLWLSLALKSTLINKLPSFNKNIGKLYSLQSKQGPSVGIPIMWHIMRHYTGLWQHIHNLGLLFLTWFSFNLGMDE